MRKGKNKESVDKINQVKKNKKKHKVSSQKNKTRKKFKQK